MAGRRFDSNKEIKKLSTMSLHFWGENPGGRWSMALRNVKPNSADSGKENHWNDACFLCQGSSLLVIKTPMIE